MVTLILKQVVFHLFKVSSVLYHSSTFIF